jgi:hypothetical protein
MAQPLDTNGVPHTRLEVFVAVANYFWRLRADLWRRFGRIQRLYSVASGALFSFSLFFIVVGYNYRGLHATEYNRCMRPKKENMWHACMLRELRIVCCSYLDIIDFK